ncbi:MAG TPA: TA system VapC family ribonuclease toxin [Terriglobales bacterium]|nr:TA system VapC family ribonuclease toxin [Terriglobales bacterium]
MSCFLLDVNVLIALLWPPHEAHARAQRWFGHNAHQGWATCAMTQADFVRIVSNPAFSRRAVSPGDALAVLSGSLQHPAHHFWTEDIEVTEALAHFGGRVLGHQQVTDAYLLGLATHKKGRLATLDTSLASLLPERSAARTRVVFL